MSEVLMAIGADSSASWPTEEKARAKFTVIRQTSQQSCIGDHSSSSVRTQRKRTNVSPGYSPTLQPLWYIILPILTSPSSPAPRSPVQPYTQTLVIHNITQMGPLMVSPLFMFHTNLDNEQITHREEESAPLLKPFRHLQYLLHVISCYWPCCFPDKWNLINHHRKLQKGVLLRGLHFSFIALWI